MSYQSIIIEIEPELIRIISYPGIDRSIPMRDIEAGERFSTRYYRNKRLGEFLKELDLSEGKCTGIPTIQEELRNNGSPAARFYTDEDRRAVTVEIPIHPDFLRVDDAMIVSEGNSPVESEKSVRSKKKVTIDNKKSIDSAHKVNVSSSNATFEREKSCVSALSATYGNGESFVSIEEVSFEEVLIRMEVKERTRENIRLLKRTLTDDIFTRTDISKLLRISGTAAGNLINKLKDAMLIVPVTGHGKGKYRFITEEDETE
ncbi:MAG: hypothetical protein LUC94_06475 [Clostridiales bacterium]|nr:hypothetical protein [Clostridiales bacterium]